MAHRDNQFDFDFIVIGSGFGGIVSALRLVEKGYKVAVMEMAEGDCLMCDRKAAFPQRPTYHRGHGGVMHITFNPLPSV